MMSPISSTWVKGYLEHEGFQVIVATDGPSAVDSARTLSPHVIVLDLMLPGFDGLEVCRRVRQPGHLSGAQSAVLHRGSGAGR